MDTLFLVTFETSKFFLDEELKVYNGLFGVNYLLQKIFYKIKIGNSYKFSLRPF